MSLANQRLHTNTLFSKQSFGHVEAFRGCADRTVSLNACGLFFFYTSFVLSGWNCLSPGERSVDMVLLSLSFVAYQVMLRHCVVVSAWE